MDYINGLIVAAVIITLTGYIKKTLQKAAGKPGRSEYPN